MAGKVENLKPYKPGQSGNPKGRPKGARTVSGVLKDMLEKMAPEEVVSTKFCREFCKGKKKVTTADAIAARLLNEALVKGESWAVKELLDRTEGKAPQSLELSNPDGTGITEPIANALNSFENALLKIYGDEDDGEAGTT